jgi:hypothetical protein
VIVPKIYFQEPHETSFEFAPHDDKLKWSPDVYLQFAKSGPRRCIHAPCYIVDVVPDIYQPRIFLSMLGLPASDIPRIIRGKTTNVSYVDVRTGMKGIMKQSSDLVNKTHGYALLVQPVNTRGIADHIIHQPFLAFCNNLYHQGNTALGAYYESMSYACDLPVDKLEALVNTSAYFNFQVNVLLAPREKNNIDLNNLAASLFSLNNFSHPFFINRDNTGSSSGLFNTVSRYPRQHKMPFALQLESRAIEKSNSNSIKVSACLIGVNYVSLQQREVIQYYLSSGFEHVYLGLPQWPTSEEFRKSWLMYRDFVQEGTLSILISEYSAEYIEPETFGLNFTYAPQGHKSSFLNTCLLVARAAGDNFAFVGDMDELIEYRYGNSTMIGGAILKQLALRNLSIEDTCAINLGSVSGHYHPDRVGFSDSGGIAEKLHGVTPGTDSVASYGKTISNVKRVLRAGLHGAAYCEDLPTEANREATRKSAMDYKINVFRPHIDDIRTLHLTDSYEQRTPPWALKMAKESGSASYYARDFSDLVASHLARKNDLRNGNEKEV